MSFEFCFSLTSLYCSSVQQSCINHHWLIFKTAACKNTGDKSKCCDTGLNLFEYFLFTQKTMGSELPLALYYLFILDYQMQPYTTLVGILQCAPPSSSWQGPHDNCGPATKPGTESQPAMNSQGCLACINENHGLTGLSLTPKAHITETHLYSWINFNVNVFNTDTILK